jgi:hypothetical protein
MRAHQFASILNRRDFDIRDMAAQTFAPVANLATDSHSKENRHTGKGSASGEC